MYEVGRVLFIDEDRVLISSLKKKLRGHGLRCHWVSTVASALRKMRHFRPDFVVLDLGLKGVDGTAFLTCARKWFPNDYPPPHIVVFSHLMDADIVDYAKEHGVLAYLYKSYGTYPLITLLKQRMAMKRPPPIGDWQVSPVQEASA